jgi:hypothetical protein
MTDRLMRGLGRPNKYRPDTRLLTNPVQKIKPRICDLNIRLQSSNLTPVTVTANRHTAFAVDEGREVCKCLI